MSQRHFKATSENFRATLTGYPATSRVLLGQYIDGMSKQIPEVRTSANDSRRWHGVGGVSKKKRLRSMARACSDEDVCSPRLGCGVFQFSLQ